LIIIPPNLEYFFISLGCVRVHVYEWVSVCDILHVFVGVKVCGSVSMCLYTRLNTRDEEEMQTNQ